MRHTFLAACLTLSAFPALAQETGHHMSSHDGIRIIHAWSVATAEASAPVYMEIQNARHDTISILGAQSSIAADVELVGMTLTNTGAQEFEPIARMPIPARSVMELAPNGLNFRLQALKAPLEKDSEFMMQIDTNLGPIEIHVQVEAKGATQHSHAGHSH